MVVKVLRIDKKTFKGKVKTPNGTNWKKGEICSIFKKDLFKVVMEWDLVEDLYKHFKT